MARQKSFIKIEGTLDELTFYKSNSKYLVKTKGGVSKERIATDPAFQRTRENGAEFGSSAASGKLLRLALRNMIFTAKDRLLTSRMMKVMSDIKNQDSTSVRGERNVGVGIATVVGKAALNGFDFNKKAILSSILFNPYLLDSATGIITLTGFKPKKDIVAPASTTHLSIRGAWARVDFTNNTYEVFESNEENLAIGAAPSDIILTPTGTPAGSGTDVFLLHVAFFQEVNGVQYSLKNGAFNSLSIIEVA